MRYLLLLALLCSGALWGQQAGTAAVERREIAAETWKRASQNLDYSKDRPKPVEEKPQPQTNPAPNMPNLFGWLDSPFWGALAQVLAVLALVAVLAYGIYRMMQEPRNARIARDGVAITAENLDHYLHETDLDRFLAEALQQQNYPLAIRIYYLQIVKRLSETGAIRWSMEKTNRDYLREMSGHAQGSAFRRLTQQYEWVWYGNAPLDAARFSVAQADFVAFSQQLSPAPRS